MPRLAINDICTGCMACMNACNKNAIQFSEDTEGFLQPVIDIDKCVECHKCELSCPEVQNRYHYNMEEPDVYAGWNNIDRRISSSGGAFSSIARYVLAKGGIIYGASLDKNMECKHIGVDKIEELDKLRGSKYIQSYIGDIFKRIKINLLNNQYVLFTGTPCQVSGLLSYLGKDNPKLITIDIVCHGVPSNALFKKYLRKMKMRLGLAKNEEIINYEFRRKDGWGFSPSISTKNSGRLKIKGVNGLYMSAFDKSAIFRLSCYKCHYANINRVGDFSIGDFWGLGHQGIPFNYDMTKGVSLMIVNSEKGRKIKDNLDRDNFFVKRTLKEAVAKNHNLTRTSIKPSNRDEVIRAFMDDNIDLVTIENKYHLIDKRLKTRLSNLSEYMGIYDLLKKIHNVIKLI